DGQRSCYIPIMKQGGNTNTIDVVNGVRDMIGHLIDIPRQMTASLVFDQSVFVKEAIKTLLHEGLLGLLLTSLMILLFLGSLRATSAVFLSIPLSALATFVVLYLMDSTVNTMILGGLALAFSRIIDNSVISLENIFRHLETGASPQAAAEVGGNEVTLAVLSATLTTVVVFFPVTFLYGVSKFLFSALAAAVVISLFASYTVAMTVVPLFCAMFIQGHHQPMEGVELEAEEEEAAIEHRLARAGRLSWFNRGFEAMLDGYERLVGVVLSWPRTTVAALLGAFALSLAIYPLLGLSFFPRT